MMAKLKRGHRTARSTVLAAPSAMVTDKSEEGGQTAVELYPINDGVQPDVLQRGRAVMACLFKKEDFKQLITCQSGDNRCMIDHLMVRKAA